MTPLDAMKQALEVFTHCYAETERRAKDRAKSLADLKAAIAELEKAEPVAWVKLNDESDFTFQKPVHEEGYQKLYAASIESKHWEITAKQLGKQLDECERERNGLRDLCDMMQKSLEGDTARIDDLSVQLASVTKERGELVRIADGIKARMMLRGFYMPQDAADLIAALAKVGAGKGEQHGN